MPLIAGNIPPVVSNPLFVLGVEWNHTIYPIFDRDQHWILVRLDVIVNVRITPELYAQYGYLYQHARQVIRNNRANHNLDIISHIQIPPNVK